MIKTELKKVILFVAGLAVLLMAASYAVRPEYDVYDLSEAANVMNRISDDPPGTVDVVFGGDSEAADGYAPIKLWKNYGISSENIAYPSQKLGDTLAIMRHLVKTQSPKLFVLEADSFFAKADVFYNKNEVHSAAEKMFPILHYHEFYRLAVSQSLEMTEKNKIANKGYWLRRNVNAYTGKKDYLKKQGKDKPITDSAARILEELVELCRENNIEILCTTVPGPNYYTVQRHDRIQKWCDAHDITYIDLNYYNDEMGINWEEDSKDGGDHLNHTGALKMNIWFGEYLKEHYDLRDHRGESGYNSWEAPAEALGGIY